VAATLAMVSAELEKRWSEKSSTMVNAKRRYNQRMKIHRWNA
jgi:hypothetical protein